MPRPTWSPADQSKLDVLLRRKELVEEDQRTVVMRAFSIALPPHLSSDPLLVGEIVTAFTRNAENIIEALEPYVQRPDVGPSPP